MKLLTSTLSVDYFLSLLLFSLLITSISASEDEVRSLLEFKKGIRIDPLGKIQNSWYLNSLDPSTCPNSFYGVYCDENEKVAAIDLNQLGLEGDIKFSTLIGLKMLRNLSLSGNLLTGRFVPALGLMSSLQHLDLSNNQFVGPIPARISELWGLNYLNLSSNNFSSGFPSGISNLQQLRVLDLHSNFLSGDVHDLLWELRNVEHVDLSNNMFYGSVSMDVMNISSMVNTVQYVNLSHNKLNGEFFGAESVSLFKNLKVLDLGDNQLTGELPSFGSLPDLSVLLLGNNQLYGSIPEELLQSSIPLVELDLSGNGFSGSLREINSTTLHTLNLSSNSLSGSLPSSLGSCIIVDLSKNMLSEDISVMQNWEPTLEVLDLSSNQLTGIIPNLTSEFTKLTTLNIRNNSIKGNLPSVFGTYPKLSSIDLSSNGFDGPIPKGFFSSMTLTTLNLSKNHFTGPIPLQGSHSSELLFLSSYPPIESIDLSDNSLTGNLPSEIGSLGRLKLINLSKNQLSGFLPDELNKLSTLEYLDLSTNDFTGKIPDKLPSSLKLLNVSHNNLSGKVPENLKSFPGNSFFPGNTLLIFTDSGQSPAAGVPSQILDNKSRKSKLSMRIVAVIVASVAAAIMIASVLTIYSRGKIKDFRGRSGFTTETTSREIKIKPPTSLSFSNDHLLTSSNQAADVVSNEIVEHAATSATSVENRNLIDIDPSSTSPVASSPVILDVYSPDRLAGELFLLDNSIDFTAGELSRAPAEVLGRSSHGTLYKATLDSGHMLTVKWLRVGLVKNKKEFAKEVKKIGAIRHQNVVPLRAYYWGPREQERLVLADYIQGDSLALHLYESTPRRYSLLSLTQRVKVAVDVARCLLYLHNQNLPHSNLKPTNIILIGSNYDAKLTDFGLHKLMTPAGIAEQILNLGALGYRAPELASTNKPVISFKADVYAFGVILMELLTRRSAGDIISGQSGAVDLTDWVKLCDQEGRGLDCIDRDIGGENLNSDAMNDLLRISIRCVSPVNERPNIRQVFDDICSISV